MTITCKICHKQVKNIGHYGKAHQKYLQKRRKGSQRTKRSKKGGGLGRKHPRLLQCPFCGRNFPYNQFKGMR